MSDQSILTRHEQAELDRKERADLKARIAELEGEVERLKIDREAIVTEAKNECADLCEIMAGEAISEGETDVAYHDTMMVARDQIRATLKEPADA